MLEAARRLRFTLRRTASSPRSPPVEPVWPRVIFARQSSHSIVGRTSCRRRVPDQRSGAKPVEGVGMGQQLKDGLGQAWAMVATFVPKLVGFLIVLLIGWLIAKAVSKALGLVLGKAGFGKLVEKTGLSGKVGQQNIDATGILVKLVYYFVLLIALQLAFGVFGPSNPVSQLLNDIIAFLPRIVVALVLVVVAAAVAQVVRDVVSSA